MNDFWATVGITAVISLAVSGLVTLWSTLRAIHRDVVIEDRRRWRDDIRELVPKLVDPSQIENSRATRNAIFLRLNPTEDHDVMSHIDAYLSDPTTTKAERVVEHFQRYLKFEWTRAKNEAGLWPFNAARRARREIRKQNRL